MTSPAKPSNPFHDVVRATPIVALDVPDLASAKALVHQLGEHCDFYKVGLELFTAAGPDVVTWLRHEGKRVFVDLKLHDIPNTVQNAARNVARLGASLLTVHASGGPEMVQAAVVGATMGSESNGMPETCGILGVTILTSLSGEMVGTHWGRSAVTVQDEVVRLAGLSHQGGAAGIVCSGHEAAAVRAQFGDQLGLLIPGIRLAGGDAHDQRRVMTVESAEEAGARWFILGRAVTAAADPAATIASVRASLGN